MSPKLPRYLLSLILLFPATIFAQSGESCANPKVISNLPYTETNASSCSYSGAGADSYCGAFRPDTEGREIYYSFTPTETTCYQINVQDWQVDPDDNDFTSDLHVSVSENCPTAGNANCIEAETINFADLSDLYLEAGKTYFFVFDHDDFNNNCIIDLDFTFDKCNIPDCANNDEAADDCVNATPICDLDGYCGSTKASHNDNGNGVNHCGSIENNTWLKFTASSTQVALKAYAYNCSNGDGIQMWVGTSQNACNWTGAASNGVACEGGSGFGVSYNDFVINGLTPGQTYYLMIDGFAGDVCNYVIEAVSGVEPLVDAGEDFTICTSGGAFQLNATSFASSGWSWITTGTGTFSNPNALQPLYTPSAADLAAGEVDLVISHPGDGICPDREEDTVKVTFIDNQATIVPQEPKICKGQSVALNVQFSNADVSAQTNPTFSNTTPQPIPDDGVSSNWNGNSGNYGASLIDVSCLNPSSWNLTQYCLNISHSFKSDIDAVYLVNACGNRIRLYTNGYTNGCFSPGTTAAWTTFLNCSDPNGTWELRVGDDFGGDNSFSLAFGTQNYQWSPATGLSATNVRNPTATPSATTTYSLSVYDCVSGCVLQDQVTVEVSDIKLNAVTANVSCNGAADGRVALVPSTYIAPAQYKLGSGAYQNDSIFSNLAPGTYVFYAKDAAGCEVSTSVTISEPSPLVLNLVQDPAAQCINGSQGKITASASGGVTPYTFSLNGAAYSTTAVFSSLASGSYDVSVKDANGCVSTENVEFFDKPIPTATVGTPSCGDRFLIFNATTNAGSISFTTTEDPGMNPVVSSTGNADEYRIAVADYGNLTLFIKAEDGICDSTISRTIKFTEQPTIDLAIDKPACDSLSAVITVDASPGNTTVTLSPSGTATPGPGVNEYTIDVNAFNTYLITVTTDNDGCIEEEKRTISFVGSSNPSIAGPYEICGTSIALNASPASGVWSKNSANVSIGDVNANNTTLNLNGGQYGSYDVFYETPALGNCPAERDTATFTFYETPQGNAGADQVICETESINLNGTVNVGTGQWTSGTGIVDANNLNSLVNIPSPGTYNYELTINNGVCPPLTDVVSIQVDEAPLVNLPDTIRFCDLTGTLSGHTPVGAVSWSTAATEISFANPSIINSGISATAAGAYKIFLTDANGSCPAAIDSTIVHFIQQPVASATAADSVCSKTFQLSATLSKADHYGFWTGSGIFNPSKNDLNPTVTVTSFGKHNFTWTEKGHPSCPGSSVVVEVEVLEQPVSDAGPDINVCGNFLSAMSANASQGTGVWTWTAVDTAKGQLVFSDINDPNASISLDSNGVGYSAYGPYQLVWTETNGSVCAPSSDTVFVHFVPSSFPNAGGDQEVCGDTTNLRAIPSYGIGQWSYTGPGVLIFADLFHYESMVWLDPSNAKYGDYELIWTEANSPCTANRDTVVITFYEPPTYDAGLSPDNVCGLDYQLAAFASHGDGVWTWRAENPSDGIITFKDGNDSISNAQISADKYGSYVLYWNISYGVCTPAPDSVKLSFWERPEPEAQAPADVCADTPNQTISLTGLASSGTKWTWVGPPGVTFVPDAFQTSVDAQVSAYGVYKFFFNEENHPVCGVVADSVFVEVLEEPEAFAGDDATTCGANFQLDGGIIKGKGDGTWTVFSQSNPGISVLFSNPADSNALVTINPAPTVDPDTVVFVWTVQSGGSCPSVSDTVEVVFEPEPQSFYAGPDTTYCDTLKAHLNADLLPSASFKGKWEIISGPGVVSFANNNDSIENAEITVSSFGVYKLIWRVNTSSCPNGVVDELILDFREKAIADAGADQEVCGSSASLSAANIPARAEGIWSHVEGGATFSNPSGIATNVSLPVGVFGPQHFVFSTKNGTLTDCAIWDRDTVEVTFFQSPLADAGADFLICGDSVKLAAVPSIANPNPSNYNGVWSIVSGPAGGTFIPNVNDPTASFKADIVGKYTLQWKEENGVCPSDSDLTVLELVRPTQPNAGVDKDTCGLRISLSADNSFNVGRWIFPDNTVQAIFTNPNAANTLLTVDRYGSFEVVWEETNSPCPANKDTVVIAFNDAPKAKPVAPQDVCGDFAHFITEASVEEAQYEAYWRADEIGLLFTDADSVETDISLNGLPFGEYKLWWVEANGSCPSDSVSTFVNFIRIPDPSAGTDSSVCGLTAPLQASGFSAASGTWTAIGTNAANASFDNANDSATTVRVSDYGVYQFVWKEVNFGKYNTDCSDSDTISIKFIENPVSYLPKDYSVCGFETEVSLVDTLAGTTISWSSNTLDIQLLDKSRVRVSKLDETPGSYWLKAVESNENLCSIADSVKITFVTQPLADAGLPFDTCGLVGGVEANASTGLGLWSYTGPGTLNFSNALNNPKQILSASTFGNYRVIWKETPDSPCLADADTLSINFFEIPDANAGNDLQVCGNQAQLAAVPSVGVGKWSYYGTLPISIVDDNNAATISILNSSNPADYQTINLDWKETNAGRCVDSAKVAVEFIVPPVAEAGADQKLCGLEAVLTGIKNIGQSKWLAVGPNANKVSVTSPGQLTTNIKAVEYGAYQFAFVVNNGVVCENDTDFVVVEFVEAPIANAGEDQALCGNSTTLTGETSRGDGSWTQISGPDAISFADINNPNSTVTSIKEGLYELVWEENVNLCPISKDTVELFFEYAPTANSIKDSVYCGLDGVLIADPTKYNGTWSIASGAGTANITNENADSTGISVSDYGSYTFYWEVQNGSLCPVAKDSAQLRFDEQPTAAVNPGLTTCENILDIEAIPSVGVGSWSFADSSQVAQAILNNEFQSKTSVQRQAGSYGSFAFVWTEVNGPTCAASTDTVTVTYMETPVIDIVGEDIVCGLNSKLQANLQVGEGVWKFEQSTSGTGYVSHPDSTITNVSAGTEGVYEFSYTADNQGFCEVEALKTVRFFKKPNADAGPDKDVCGLEMGLRGTTATGKGKWSTTGPLTFNNNLASITTVRADTFGIFEIIWTEDIGSACPPSSDTLVATFVQTAVANAGQDQDVCGLGTQLEAVPSQGYGYWTSLNPGISFLDAKETPNASIVAADYGVYQLVWKEFNGLPCDTLSDTLSINFIEAPSIAFTTNDTVLCQGDVAVVDVLSKGVAPFTFTVDGSDLSSQKFEDVAANFSFNLNPASDSVRYIISSLNDNSAAACRVFNQDTLYVKRYAEPTASIDGDFKICDGEEVVVSISFTGNKPFSTELSNGESLISNSNTMQYAFVPSADTSLTLIGAQDSLCVADVSGLALVDWNPNPALQVNLTADTLCEGDVFNFDLLFDGLFPVDVYYATATLNNSQLGLTQDLNLNLVANQGIAFFRVDSLVSKGGSKVCKAVGLDSIPLHVHALPTLISNVDPYACVGSTVQLHLAFNGTAPFELQMENQGQNLSYTDLKANDSIALQPGDWANFKLLTITDANKPACSNTIDVEHVVEAVSPPTAVLTVNPDDICAGEEVGLELTFTGVAPFNYSIGINDNPISDLSMASTVRDSLRLFLDTKFELLTLSDGSPIHCPAVLPAPSSVKVKPLPYLEFSALGTEGCKPFTTQFINESDRNAIASLTWDFGDGSSDTDYNPSHRFENSGYYDVRLSAVGVNGCANSIEKQKFIQIYPDAIADFDVEPKELRLDDMGAQFTNLSENATSYRWIFDDAETSGQQHPFYEFTPNDSLKVKVCLEAIGLCPDTICKIIPVVGKHLVYVPNAFTPNGDGQNDYFFPELLGEDITEFEFSVYDRWGERIYFTKNTSGKWDGTYKGATVQEGVYPYKVIVKDRFSPNKQEIVGHVTIIK